MFLAGDAAHLMPPFAGQGMNSGVRDAHNIAWKLASVAKGQAGPGLLDSYETERREHAAKMIDLSRMIGRVIMPTSRMQAALRDAFFRLIGLSPAVRDWFVQMRFKPPPRYSRGAIVPRPGQPDPDSPVGRMFIQPVLRMDGTDRRLDDVIGPGFALLGLGRDPAACLDEGGRQVVQRLGARLLAIDADATGGTTDPSGELRAWAGRNRAEVVLLRPDRYVAALGAAAEINGLLAAFDRAAAGQVR